MLKKESFIVPVLAASMTAGSVGESEAANSELEFDQNAYCVTEPSDRIFYSPDFNDAVYKDDNKNYVYPAERETVKRLATEFLNINDDSEMLKRLENDHEKYFQIYHSRTMMDTETGEIITLENDYPTRKKEVKRIDFAYFYYADGVASDNDPKFYHIFAQEKDVDIDGEMYYLTRHSIIVDMDNCELEAPLLSPEDVRDEILEQLDLPPTLGELDLRDANGTLGQNKFNKQIIAGNLKWTYTIPSSISNNYTFAKHEIEYEVGKFIQLDLISRMTMEDYQSLLHEQEIAPFRPDLNITDANRVFGDVFEDHLA